MNPVSNEFALPVRRTAVTIIFFTLLSGAWLTVPAGAQTPATSIENGSEELRLQLNYDGGLYVPGEYAGVEASGDSIPATGAGTRMMWYPAKAAFRAGHIDNFFGDGAVEWDASNVGQTSAAFNYNTTASGPHSFAIGTKTTASSVGAVAMGFFTEAADTNAVAMGSFTTANAPRATAMGNSTVASGKNSLATGVSTEASGQHSFATGLSTAATAGGAFSTGFDTEASGVNSFATGEGTQASGPLAATMGNLTTAATGNSLSIGRCNSANTSTDGSLLVAGNGNRSGDACGSRSDALRLDFDGNMTIAGNLTENSDRRLKTNIKPLSGNVLSTLQEIDPVRFHFKDERTHPAGEQIGLIAQEVQREFPELVSEGANGMLSLSYTKFSAVLLKGLQEQQSTIEKQQAQINDLKVENEEIKKRLAALEAEQSSPAVAGLMGGWGLALVLGLGGLVVGVLLRRRS